MHTLAIPVPEENLYWYSLLHRTSVLQVLIPPNSVVPEWIHSKLTCSEHIGYVELYGDTMGSSWAIWEIDHYQLMKSVPHVYVHNGNIISHPIPFSVKRLPQNQNVEVNSEISIVALIISYAERILKYRISEKYVIQFRGLRSMFRCFASEEI